MTEQEFMQATMGATEQRDITVKEVLGGFMLQGVRRFVDPDTGGIRVQQNLEAVATEKRDASNLASAFIENGNFNQMASGYNPGAGTRQTNIN